MTNNQAIEKLNDIRCHVKETSTEEQALVMAINALEAQLSQEGTTKDATSDTISRQEAIDALAKQMPTPYTPDGSHPADECIFQVQEVYVDCIETLELLPSAQPEERTKKRTETHASDLISRQAAIDAVALSAAEWDGMYVQDINGRIRKALEKLPSAQPERKAGKWTEDNACEFCGFKPWYERDIHTLSYCPNCGADMRGAKVKCGDEDTLQGGLMSAT